LTGFPDAVSVTGRTVVWPCVRPGRSLNAREGLSRCSLVGHFDVRLLSRIVAQRNCVHLFSAFSRFLQKMWQGVFLSIDFLPVFVLIILLGLICLGFGFVPCGRLIRQALFSNLYQQL